MADAIRAVEECVRVAANQARTMQVVREEILEVARAFPHDDERYGRVGQTLRNLAKKLQSPEVK